MSSNPLAPIINFLPTVEFHFEIICTSPQPSTFCTAANVVSFFAQYVLMKSDNALCSELWMTNYTIRSQIGSNT